jgi:hypothetical protein
MPTYDNTNCQAPGGIGFCNTFSYLDNAFVSFQTNMTTTGAYTPGSTLTLTYSNAPPQAGFQIEPTFFDTFQPDPLNKHLNGWTTPNFINYSVYPVSLTTLAPISGSQAIGQATSLTGVAALYPPRFNAVDSVMSPFKLRTDLTTLGAYDPSGAPPTPVSIAVLPNPLGATTSTSGSLTCTTTLSNASTRSCISPSCTSTNTGSMTISGLNWTATSTPGSGTLNCTAESLTAPGDAFTTTAPPVTTTISIGGGISFSGSVAIQQ